MECLVTFYEWCKELTLKIFNRLKRDPYICLVIGAGLTLYFAINYSILEPFDLPLNLSFLVYSLVLLVGGLSINCSFGG